MPKRSDYDSPWKDLVEKYFQQFMEFFFSHIAVNIDWKKGYEFLDKEFQKIAVTSKTGRRYADKLVKVKNMLPELFTRHIMITKPFWNYFGS